VFAKSHTEPILQFVRSIDPSGRLSPQASSERCTRGYSPNRSERHEIGLSVSAAGRIPIHSRSGQWKSQNSRQTLLPTIVEH
jgi:hypothetical protein